MKIIAAVVAALAAVMVSSTAFAMEDMAKDEHHCSAPPMVHTAKDGSVFVSMDGGASYVEAKKRKGGDEPKLNKCCTGCVAINCADCKAYCDKRKGDTPSAPTTPAPTPSEPKK